MSEQVITYLLSNPYNPIFMDRDQFYNEQMEAWEANKQPTRAVETVAIFLFNGEGKLLIQKRNRTKRHNPRAFDKSVGGHMVAGNNLKESAFFELIQEMHVPSTIHTNDDSFMKYLVQLTKIDDALKHIAVVKFIDTSLHLLERIIDEKKYIIATKAHLFFGFYDGGVFPSDKESTGYAWTDLDELLQDMEDSSGFTKDLHHFITNYKEAIHDFIQIRINLK